MMRSLCITYQFFVSDSVILWFWRSLFFKVEEDSFLLQSIFHEAYHILIPSKRYICSSFYSLAFIGSSYLQSSLLTFHYHIFLEWFLSDEIYHMVSRSCLGKDSRFWLMARSCIICLYIPSSIFIIALQFRLSLVQSLASSLSL